MVPLLDTYRLAGLGCAQKRQYSESCGSFPVQSCSSMGGSAVWVAASVNWPISSVHPVQRVTSASGLAETSSCAVRHQTQAWCRDLLPCCLQKTTKRGGGGGGGGVSPWVKYPSLLLENPLPSDKGMASLCHKSGRSAYFSTCTHPIVKSLGFETKSLWSVWTLFFLVANETLCFYF